MAGRQVRPGEERHLRTKLISGVVEGFYGRPWSQDQRKDLFRRLKEYNLNTYMYAPKDDALHRKLWRQLYDDVEEENLKCLINSAESNGIKFVYAISPGVDMIFSCPKDVQALKSKLKQIADLGCKSFAVLFDDIEPELNLPDKDDFDSFADAQVSITNSIYEFLDKPNLFLFCPTEYCATRAKPSVESSEYLRIIGSKLNSNIDILWTGPKVVSKDISIPSIKLISKVLKRKPVIWDNIHANDYDQRRIFLGPFDGRPTELYQHLNGILTNPNCEYEMNFVALHTIAQWTKCCVANLELQSSQEEIEMLSAAMHFDSEFPSHDQGVRMELSESESCRVGPTDCKEARRNEVTTAHSALPVKAESKSHETGDSTGKSKELLDAVEYDARLALDNAVHDWLEEFKKVKSLRKKNLDLSTSPSKLAALDCFSYLSETNDDEESASKRYEILAKIEEGNETSACCAYHMSGKRIKLNKRPDSNVTKEDLLLMVDLFFLPYEHGGKAKHLVSEFKWLRSNAPPINVTEQNGALVDEWEKRATHYRSLCQEIVDMFHRVSHAPNKPLVQELYPYIWDMKEVSMMLEAFVKWLGSKSRKCKTGSNHIPEDPEPWTFKGGIAEELERLLPVEMANELSPAANLSVTSPVVYTIRPHMEIDKADLYNLCIKLHQDKLNETNLFPNYPDLPGDWLLGAFLGHKTDTTLFVLEDEDSVCGYCGGAFEARDFHAKSNKWLAEISSKYSAPISSSLSAHEELLIQKIRGPVILFSNELYQRFPAQIVINLLPRAQVSRICKRLLYNVISTLRSKQVKGVHCHIDLCNQFVNELLKDIGFSRISLRQEITDDVCILGMEL